MGRLTKEQKQSKDLHEYHVRVLEAFPHVEKLLELESKYVEVKNYINNILTTYPTKEEKANMLRHIIAQNPELLKIIDIYLENYDSRI